MNIKIWLLRLKGSTTSVGATAHDICSLCFAFGPSTRQQLQAADWNEAHLPSCPLPFTLPPTPELEKKAGPTLSPTTLFLPPLLVFCSIPPSFSNQIRRGSNMASCFRCCRCPAPDTILITYLCDASASPGLLWLDQYI